jgi:hypothetical protein
MESILLECTVIHGFSLNLMTGNCIGAADLSAISSAAIAAK